RNRVPASAVQRPRGARAVGQLERAEPVHGRCGVGAGAALDRAHGVCRLSRHQRTRDRRDSRGRHAARRGGARRGDSAAAAAGRADDGRRAVRQQSRTRNMAHAAARHTVEARHDALAPYLDGCAARLSGGGRRARDREGGADCIDVSRNSLTSVSKNPDSPPWAVVTEYRRPVRGQISADAMRSDSA
ncbi:conserved hypothetical protein, partial [Ricinus communis]